MKIGVVTTSYPRFAGDHAGNFVHAQVEALRRLGHDVEVVGAHHIASELFGGAGAPDALEAGGVRTLLSAAKFTAQLTASVAWQARSWDLMIAHWLAPSALAALPSRVPLLAIGHGGDIHTLRRMRMLGAVMRMLRLRRARLVFTNDEMLKLAQGAASGAWLDRAAIVQPMGLPLAHFASLGRALTTPPTILVVARLVPIKGVDVMLRALDHLRTPAQLVIAGDGPERARLEGAALGRATFLGAVSTTERDRLLRQASVVVVPSRVLDNGRTEGTPLIALEALAAGVPVVASAVGGLRALPTTLRVRPNEPRTLAAAIDRILASPPASTELIESVAAFDAERVARRLLEHAGCEAGDPNRRRSA